MALLSPGTAGSLINTYYYITQIRLPVFLMVERTADVELGYSFVLAKFIPISLDHVYRYGLINI